MGANGSTQSADRHGYYHSEYKPCVPEGIPKVTDVTHNSVTLSWIPTLNSGRILAYRVECLNLKNKKWKIVTSTCQGTTYRVRNLLPESCYVFRVRAENLVGLSRPGQASDEIRTRPVPTNYLEEKSLVKLTRRHSHMVKIDGGLNKIEDQVDSNKYVAGLQFRRNQILRGSLPMSFRTGKISNIGNASDKKREDMSSLQESKQSSLETTQSEEGMNLKRVSTSSTEASSLFSSNSVTSIVEEDGLRMSYEQTDCHICSDNDDTYSTTNSHITTSSGFSSGSSRSSYSAGHTCTHNALVHSLPNHCSHNALVHPHRNCPLSATTTDDTKMEYCSQSEKILSMKSDLGNTNANTTCRSQCLSGKTDSKSDNPNIGKSIFDICDNEIWKGRIGNTSADNTVSSNECNTSFKLGNNGDLRSIKNMLNSQEGVAYNTWTLEKSRTHFVIKELDEDTGVDIVLTI